MNTTLFLQVFYPVEKSCADKLPWFPSSVGRFRRSLAPATRESVRAPFGLTQVLQLSWHGLLLSLSLSLFVVHTSCLLLAAVVTTDQPTFSVSAWIVPLCVREPTCASFFPRPGCSSHLPPRKRTQNLAQTGVRMACSGRLFPRKLVGRASLLPSLPPCRLAGRLTNLTPFRRGGSRWAWWARA